MSTLRKTLIDELAFGSHHGIGKRDLQEIVQAQLSDNKSELISAVPFEEIFDQLRTENIIREVKHGVYVLSKEARLIALGVHHLPMISDNAQSMRILDHIARSRERGCWSYSMCSALKVDAKQLFHLSNILVEFGIIQRFSNVPLPRQLKPHTNATHSSFFILSRFSRMAIDPEITDVIDPVHSTENVCSLITSLLREAGGIMIISALRSSVVSQGGFTNKQFHRGKNKLVSNRRLEVFVIPKVEDMVEEDEDVDDAGTDEKIDPSKFVHAIRLLDVSEVREIKQSPESQAAEDVIKEEDILATPPDSEPEDTSYRSSKQILISNLFRSKCSFREAILIVIAAGGPTGVTTRDISIHTGIPTKEILKAMEVIRVTDQLETSWRNDGKKKYIVYRMRTRPSIRTDDEVMEISEPSPLTGRAGKTPRSSKGYVTDQTVRRSSTALDIVSSRIALSLIDLGHAIEAHEAAAGTGIPGAQIDRRTLKKICDIAKIPLIEKGESNSSKLIIAFDPSQISAEEAMRRVDRPIGITPKSTTSVIKPSILTPSSISSVETPSRRMNISELMSKGRLAALAVFGKNGGRLTSSAPSYHKAQLYGFIRGGGEVYKSKLIHQYLVSVFGTGSSVSLTTMIDSMPLVLFLQAIGCGVEHPFLDGFISSTNADLDTVLGTLPVEVRTHLRGSVPSSLVTTTPEKQLSKALVILVKLGLLRVEKSGNNIVYLIQPEGGGVMGEIEMDRVSFDSQESVEEFWRSLHRTCMQWRDAKGAGRYPAGNLAHHLFKAQQWKCRIQVTLAQRRDLESLLRSFVAKADSEGFSADNPLILDGSNEEIARISIHTKMDISATLKALSRLQRLLYQGKQDKVVFASVHQARFSCPHCSQLFFQLSSIERHFQAVHPKLPVPTNVQTFTRPEYLSAIAKLRSVPKKEEGERRRRRRRRERHQTKDRLGSPRNGQEALQMAKLYSIACDLAGRRPVPPPTDVEPDDILWKIVDEILNGKCDSESVEITRLRVVGQVTGLMVGGARSSIASADNRAEVIARLLVVNKVVDADMAELEGLCKRNKIDFMSSVDLVLKQWHLNGMLAIEKRNVRNQQVSYTLSRQGKIDLFGKFGDIDRFVRLVRERHRGIDFVFDSEQTVISHFGLVDRLGNEGTEIYCEFDEFVPSTEPEDEDNTEDDFKGIKKHIELAGSVNIDRVTVVAPKVGGKNAILSIFLDELARMHSSSLSNIWRPTERKMSEFEIESKAEQGETIKNRVREHLGYTINCPNDWSVMVPRPKDSGHMDSFVDSLYALSPKFFCWFSPACTLKEANSLVPLTTWTSMDGDLRSNILADLLLHILFIAFSCPGISAIKIKERMRLLPLSEVELLVSVWQDAGVLSDNMEELFLTPLYIW